MGADVLVFPDPGELEGRRRELVRERFIYRLWVSGSIVACYINFAVGVGAALQFNLSKAWVIAVAVLFGLLPLIGVFYVNRWKNRRTRVVADAVKVRLGVKERQEFVWVVLVPAFIAGAAIPFGIKILSGLFVLSLACLLPWMRRRSDPDTPLYVLLINSGWLFVAGLLVIFVVDDWSPGIVVVWVLLGPSGLPARLLRRPVMKLVRRNDRVGRMARVYAAFFPVAQLATVARLCGKSERARMLLEGYFQSSKGMVSTGEVLLELAAVETDPEAKEAWLAGAAILLADRPEPFAEAAKHFERTGDARAFGYACFAEDNASRNVTRGVAEYTELRMRLEVG